MIEDIAYDPATKSFILSSVHRRKILSCDRRGRCRDAIRSTADVVLDAVLAIHVDRLHGVLWATTASMDAETEYQPRDEGRSSILKFRLPSYRLIKRYEPDDGQKHAMGDMTVASNGDAYISDGDSGDVFVVSHQRDLLEPLVPKGTFVSPQTPALSPDETLLYVADYSTGIAAIRLADGHVDWIKSTVPAAFEGIDGLYCAGDRLIAVQNGTMPERIVSFHLKNAYEVNGFEVLDANWQGLGDPTHGVIVGREFFFIANSGWDRVDKDGNFKPGEPAEVRKISLH